MDPTPVGWAVALEKLPLVRALVSRRIPASDREDLIQDILLSIATHYPDCKDLERIDGWVVAIILNKIRHKVRRDRVAWRFTGRVVGGHEDPVDGEAYDSAAACLKISEALRRLPPRQRLAVMLFHVWEIRGRQVAELLGISEGAVRTLAARARVTLQRLLWEDACLSSQQKINNGSKST